MAKKNPESMWPLYVLGGAVLGAGLYYLLKKNSVLAAPPEEVNLPLGEGDDTVPASVDSGGSKDYSSTMPSNAPTFEEEIKRPVEIPWGGMLNYELDQWGKPVFRS